MKLFKRVLCLCFAAALAAGLLSACDSTEAKMQALSGTWTMTASDTEEQARSLLENIDLYEEEIALVDLASLDEVKLVKFDMEGNYSFSYDEEGLRDCVRSFYLGAFDAMYEGRSALNEVYDMSFDAMSREEFDQFYLELYEYTDFDMMIRQFTDWGYDYEALGEPWETGTFTIEGNILMCTITGENEAESLGYDIDGDTLTLTFSDGVQIYSKDN